jgi:hypothetical protein
MAYNIGVANFRCTWFLIWHGVTSPWTSYASSCSSWKPSNEGFFQGASPNLSAICESPKHRWDLSSQHVIPTTTPFLKVSINNMPLTSTNMPLPKFEACLQILLNKLYEFEVWRGQFDCISILNPKIDLI